MNSATSKLEELLKSGLNDIGQEIVTTKKEKEKKTRKPRSKPKADITNVPVKAAPQITSLVLDMPMLYISGTQAANVIGATLEINYGNGPHYNNCQIAFSSRMINKDKPINFPDNLGISQFTFELLDAPPGYIETVLKRRNSAECIYACGRNLKFQGELISYTQNINLLNKVQTTLTYSVSSIKDITS